MHVAVSIDSCLRNSWPNLLLRPNFLFLEDFILFSCVFIFSYLIQEMKSLHLQYGAGCHQRHALQAPMTLVHVSVMLTLHASSALSLYLEVPGSCMKHFKGLFIPIL